MLNLPVIVWLSAIAHDYSIWISVSQTMHLNCISYLWFYLLGLTSKCSRWWWKFTISCDSLQFYLHYPGLLMLKVIQTHLAGAADRAVVWRQCVTCRFPAFLKVTEIKIKFSPSELLKLHTYHLLSHVHISHLHTFSLAHINSYLPLIFDTEIATINLCCWTR